MTDKTLDQMIDDAGLRWCADHQYDTSKDRGIAFKDGAYWMRKHFEAEINQLNYELDKSRSDHVKIISQQEAEIEKLKQENSEIKEKLEIEENWCLQLISERDFREEQINDIADHLGDNREWSNMNDRAENCIESIALLQHKIEKLKQANSVMRDALKFVVNVLK